MNDEKKKKLLSYYALRNWVMNQLLLEGERANIQFMNFEYLTKHSTLIESTLRYCIVENGKRELMPEEAVKIAEVYIKKEADKRDPLILNKLIFDFLKTYLENEENRANIDNIVEDYMIGLYIKNNKNYIPPKKSQKQPEENQIKRYSNLQNISDENRIILEDVKALIKQKIQEKQFIFLSGFHGSGKNYIANLVAHEYYDNQEVNFAFHIDCDSKTSSDQIFQTIVSVFSPENLANYSTFDGKRKTQDYLSENKAVILITGFDRISNAQEQKNILDFIINNIVKESIVIITSSERINKYPLINIKNSFTEIVLRPFTKEELQTLAKAYKDKQIVEAREKFNGIDDFAIDNSYGNPTLMFYILNSIAHKVLLGDNIQNIIQNYKGISDFDDFFEKIKNDLDNNCLSVLVTLSLFANPISEELLNTISQDHNTNEQCQDNTSTSIVEIIQTLENKLLIKSERSKNENGAMTFSLSGVIKTAIENEKNRNPGKYKAIYDRWINYYIDFSYKNAESQSLKSEIKNIERVLAYCEEKKLWDNYYILSQNMSNYYLQNDYRTGNDSILYKRYFAAQNVSKKIPERRFAIFYSLLDYCHYTYVRIVISASGNMDNKNKSYKSGLLDSINQDFSILERLYKKYRLFIPKQKKLVFYKTKVLNIFVTGKSKGATAAYKKWESLVFQTAAFEINQKE